MKPDADMVMRKLAQNPSFCGLQKLNSLNPPFAYDNTFSNYDIPLYVPESAINSYQATSPWNKFKTFNTPSDIQNVTIDNGANAPVYDLNGRRLQEAAKGINIIGGKKKLKH